MVISSNFSQERGREQVNQQNRDNTVFVAALESHSPLLYPHQGSTLRDTTVQSATHVTILSSDTSKDLWNPGLHWVLKRSRQVSCDITEGTQAYYP